VQNLDDDGVAVRKEISLLVEGNIAHCKMSHIKMNCAHTNLKTGSAQSVFVIWKMTTASNL